MTQLTAAFPPARRGKALGLLSGFTGLAVFGGPFVGGALAQGLDWQWIFWLNVPVGILAILLVRIRLQESRGPNSRLDVGGAVLVTLAALGLVWKLVRRNDGGWGAPKC
jgi:MFS family permease